MAKILVVLQGGARDGEQWPIDEAELESSLAFSEFLKLPAELYVITAEVVTLADGQTARVARPAGK